jgi:hypothetical protein
VRRGVIVSRDTIAVGVHKGHFARKRVHDGDFPQEAQIRERELVRDGLAQVDIDLFALLRLDVRGDALGKAERVVADVPGRNDDVCRVADVEDRRDQDEVRVITKQIVAAGRLLRPVVT